MSHGFGVLIPLGVSDGEHVEGVIVVWILVANQPKMGNGLVVLATVDRERRRVQPLVHGLRRILALCGLTLADVQVQAHPLVKFFLVRILPEHRFKSVDRCAVVVPLQRLEAPFVQRHSLGRSTLRCRGNDRLSWL